MGYGTTNKILEYIPIFNIQDQIFLTNKSLQYFEIELTNSQKNKLHNRPDSQIQIGWRMKYLGMERWN